MKGVRGGERFLNESVGDEMKANQTTVHGDEKILIELLDTGLF